MHELTSSTMAEFGVQRFVAVQDIGHLATVTASSPLHRAKLVWGLDGIGRPGFPGVVFFGQRIMGTRVLSHSVFAVCLLSFLSVLAVSCSVSVYVRCRLYVSVSLYVHPCPSMFLDV